MTSRTSSGRPALHSWSMTVASRSPNGRDRRGSGIGTSGCSGRVALLLARTVTPGAFSAAALKRDRRGGYAVAPAARDRRPARRVSARGAVDLGVAEPPPGALAAGLPSRLVVEPRVLARPDPAEPRLVGDGSQVREVPAHARVGRRGDGHRLRGAVEGAQGGRRGGAEGAVGPGVGGIGGRGGQRVPRRVAAELDRRDRAPDRVGVLRVVHRDGGVGQSEVHGREGRGRLGEAGAAVRDDLLRDLVPGVQTGAELQNFPATVWSGVRVVLESRPRSRTSASAAAYAGVVTAGGAAGRNRCGPSSRNGVTLPQDV